jgi:hypothetical protein
MKRVGEQLERPMSSSGLWWADDDDDDDIENGTFRTKPGQEHQKPASVYEEFDESGKSERYV